MALAQGGVQRLEPDLVILDEFQRFRHLLDPEGGEAAGLAHHLFDYGDAKVLLLSATPYKPFTLAEESELGEDHYRDFCRTLEFLNPDPAWSREVGRAFSAYRDAVVYGQDAREPCDVLRRTLLQVMSRTERPAAAQEDMLDPQPPDPVDVRPSGVSGYVALHRLAKAVDARLTIEYWKSAPYFLNFTDGDQLGDKLRAALRQGGTAELDEVLRAAQVIDTKAMRGFKPVDLGNARLRQLEVDLALYRLAFGQPRQEDMLELLRRNGVTARQVDEFALDLRPRMPANLSTSSMR